MKNGIEIKGSPVNLAPSMCKVSRKAGKMEGIQMELNGQ